jgi:hypothetical protein
MDRHHAAGRQAQHTDAHELRAGADRLQSEVGRRLSGRLEAWLSEAVVEEAARTRARRAWLRRLRDEDRSVVGLLLGAASRGERLSLGTVTGDIFSGLVLAVGADVVVLEGAGGATVLVALDAVTEVACGTAVDTAEPGTRTLADALRLLDPGTEIRITTRAGGATRIGHLAAVGRDVVSLERDARVLLHVPLQAIVAVRVEEPVD